MHPKSKQLTTTALIYIGLMYSGAPLDADRLTQMNKFGFILGPARSSVIFRQVKYHISMPGWFSRCIRSEFPDEMISTEKKHIYIYKIKQYNSSRCTNGEVLKQ